MVLATATVVLVLASLFFIHRWTRSGLADIPMWFVFSAILLVFLAHYSNAWENGPGLSGWTHRGLLVVSSGLALFILGAVITRAVQYSSSREPVSLTTAPLPVATKRLVVFSIITLLPAWSYFILLGYVPLFDGLGAVATQGLDGLGALQASRLSRDGYASENGVIIPGQGLLQLMRNVGVPALAGYAVAQIQIYGFSRFRLIITIISTVTVLLAGQRWPLVYLGVAILAALAVKKIKFSLTRILVIVAPILIVGVIQSVMQRRTLTTFDSWSSAILFSIQDLFDRVVYDQSYVTLLSYKKDTYPGGSLEGRSYLDSLASYAPGPGASFPVEFYMEVMETSHAYTAAPDFFTEAYINFGMFGVIIISFLWGVILQLISEMVITKDVTLNGGLKAGGVAVLAQSAYTGAIFTLSGAIIFTLILCGVVLLVPWPGPRKPKFHRRVREPGRPREIIQRRAGVS